VIKNRYVYDAWGNDLAPSLHTEPAHRAREPFLLERLQRLSLVERDWTVSRRRTALQPEVDALAAT